jgi:hypothetical protein
MIYPYNFIPFLCTQWLANLNLKGNSSSTISPGSSTTVGQASHVHAIGSILVGLGRERYGPHQPWPTRPRLLPALRCCSIWSLIELQQILQLARNNHTSCVQVSKLLVAYIVALIVISPYSSTGGPLTCIVSIADARDLLLSKIVRLTNLQYEFNLNMN